MTNPQPPESSPGVTPLTKETRDSLFFRASRVVSGDALLGRTTLRERMDWAKTILRYEASLSAVEAERDALAAQKAEFDRTRVSELLDSDLRRQLWNMKQVAAERHAEAATLRAENARLRGDREALIGGATWQVVNPDATDCGKWRIMHRDPAMLGVETFDTADDALDALHASRSTELDND